MAATDPTDAPPDLFSPPQRLAALAVHLFTASGAALGFLALIAATERDFAKMFFWLAIALLVDGVDGTLARKAHVDTRAPKLSGDVLDLVVDYVTYVLVPAYALAVSGLMPHGFGVPAALIVCVTAALYFATTDMKTDDLFFRGFPGIWNVAAFYLFVLAPPPWIGFAIVVALSALTFAPIVFVHPMRVRLLRPLTLAALLAWSVLAALAVWSDLRPDAFVIWGLVALALYFVSLGLFRGRNLS